MLLLMLSRRPFDRVLLVHLRLAVLAGCGGATAAPVRGAGVDDEQPAEVAEATEAEGDAEEVTMAELFDRVRLQLVDVEVAEVPLTRSWRGILVPGFMPGADDFVPLIVDSGAPNIVAPAHLPDEDYRLAVGQAPIQNASGVNVTLPVHLMAGVAVGEQAAFTEVVGFEWWFEDGSPARCLSDAGIVGYSVMRTGAWQLDFRADLLRIAEGLEALPTEDYRPFPLDAEGYEMYLTVSVEGRELRALLDTGYGGDLMLDESTFAELFPDAERRPSASVVAFGQPTVSETPYAITEVRLGAADGVPLTVEVEPAAESALGVRALMALAGVAWDARAGRLLIGPPTRATSVTPPRPIVAFWEDERSVVRLVRGEAATAGLRAGDVLVRADEIDLRTGGFEAYCALLLAPSSPRSVTVEREGAERTFQLDAP